MHDTYLLALADTSFCSVMHTSLTVNTTHSLTHLHLANMGD